jgi:hypothetical protein
MNRFHDEAREAKIMLGKAGTVARVATVAVISESDEHPGAWDRSIHMVLCWFMPLFLLGRRHGHGRWNMQQLSTAD